MKKLPEDDIRTWPRGLAEIARLIGAKPAMDLAEAVGGVETYIPKSPRSDHYLVRIVGPEAMKKLAAEYGGQTVAIPRGVYRGLKKAAIMDATGSRRQVALALGCSTRYVRKISNQAKTESGHGNVSIKTED